MSFAHNFILENTSLHRCSFHLKKERTICIPKSKWKLQNKRSFIFFFCLILLSYLHTTLFQSSSFSPNPHGKIFKCFRHKPIQVLMACFGFLLHWMAMEALMTKKTGLGDFEVNEDPNGPKGVHEDPTLLYIYKMGICQLEWWPRKRTKS